MNRFELIGKVVGYGTSSNNDWIEINTGEDSITVYLEDNDLSYYEENYNLHDSHKIKATGYMKPNNQNDDVTLIATFIEVK